MDPSLQSKSTILVVDDTTANIDILVGLLSPAYRVKVATNGPRALDIAAGDAPPDIVLLDIMMPQMDGYEVCARLKGSPATSDIPVIFVTAKDQEEDEARGFELGAVDYISKPISPTIVLARVRTHLDLRAARNALRHENRRLEVRVRERTQEIATTQEVTIQALASLAETRDNDTGGHIRRTQHYVRLLAEILSTHPRFPSLGETERMESIYRSSPLHDIGKVGVPDRILLKPGPLTAEEWVEMRRHTEYGRDAIVHAEEDCGVDADTSFLRAAREIAYTHHEKWDGSGYPEGLTGRDIPVSGRLMAIADVYDALITERVYKPPFPHEEALRIITEGRGTHFDPDIVDTFLEHAGAIQDIARRFAD